MQEVFHLGPNRRTILSAGMVAVRDRVQREGEVVHLVAQRLTDLSTELASVGERWHRARGRAQASRNPLHS